MYSADACRLFGRRQIHHSLGLYRGLVYCSEFVIWGFFTKSRILKFSISMISITLPPYSRLGLYRGLVYCSEFVIWGLFTKSRILKFLISMISITLPPYRRTKPRLVRQFKNANWEAIRQQIRSCWTSFSKNSPSRSVNENWLKLKSILNQCLDKFIPTKMTSPQENLPWLSKSLLASIRKKTSLYSKAKSTNKADLWAKYKLCKQQTQRAIRSARCSFLKNKLSEFLEQKILNHSGVISNQNVRMEMVSLLRRKTASCIQIADVKPKY